MLLVGAPQGLGPLDIDKGGKGPAVTAVYTQNSQKMPFEAAGMSLQPWRLVNPSQ